MTGTRDKDPAPATPPAAVMPSAAADDPGATRAPPPGAAPEILEDSAGDNPFSMKGRTIGPYRISAQIGVGGMGAVYLADQTAPVRRQVALKVIKAGFDSEELLSRFRDERELLARMSHPNIAQVLDVGATGEGRLYFAMEYVPGVPLDEFCDRRGTDLAHRVELFLQVLEGVQHAHQKGVIHRDLKPGNLLVADYQGQVLVKVIDFGIAKSLDPLGRPEPGTTRAGMPLGTPAYMSPEQAGGDPGAIDTRTDVYALGVVLYKLVTHELPIPGEVISRTPDGELAKLLNEYPIRPPSKRVAELPRNGDTLWRKAMSSDAPALSRRLRGDLDWIVLKALERDRDRRYASASEFAADIRRFLNGEAVLASPPSRMYLARKFVARNRLMVGAAGAVLLSLVAGIVGTTWMALEARSQRARADTARVAAETESARARATQGFLERMIAAPDPWKLRGDVANAREVKVADALQSAGRELDATLVDDPILRGEIGTLLGRTLRRLGLLEAAQAQLEPAVATLVAQLPADDADRVQAELELALVRAERGEFQPAQDALKPLLPRLESIQGLAPGTVEESRRAVAELSAQLGDGKAAVAMARANLVAAEAASGADSTDASGARASLADLLGAEGEYAEADALFQLAYEAERKRLGPAHPVVLQLLWRGANLALRRGDYALAEQRYREAAQAAEQVLGPEHPDTLRYLAHVATALSNAGRNAEAIPLFERIIGMRSRLLGADHPDVLTMRANLAIALRTEKRGAEAERVMQEVYDRRRAVLGEAHPETIRTLSFLAVMARDRNDLAKAEVLLGQAAHLYAQANGPDHPETILIENNYLSVLRDRGDIARAISGFAALLPRATKALPAGNWQLAAIRGGYGKALYLDGRFEEAEPLILDSWRTISGQFPAGDPRTVAARARVVEMYKAWGRPGSADAAFAAAAGPTDGAAQ
jgi:non-specific serine/threonine protein kinase/serine/threonine-protein kinase